MTSIKAAVQDLLGRRELTLEDAADRHYHPLFRQRTDGQWEDRASFLAHMATLRDSIDRFTMTVLDELALERRYAERHIIDVVTTDGRRLNQEVYLFGERDADGRFTWIEEVTRPLGDAEA